MSEKSKKPKKADPVDEVPMDMEDDFEEVRAEEKKPKSGKTDGIMAKANAMASKKRGIDPIIAVSAILLMLACVIVIGNTVYDNTLADHTEARVEYGSNVEVDYIGCYGAFYDTDQPKNGAVIFDTSISTLNKDVPTSYEYNPNFKTLTFEAGKSTTLLSKFQNAVIGLRPGQTTQVFISAADGYGELSESQKNALAASYTISNVYVFPTKTAFKDAFGVEAPTTGIMYVQAYTDDMDTTGVQSSPYGFAAEVTADSSGVVTVKYIAESGKTYVMNEYVHAKVTAVADDKITFSYEIQTDKVVSDKITLVKGFVDNQAVYIKLDGSGNVLYYKTTEEKVGENLWFTITVLRYVEKTSS